MPDSEYEVLVQATDPRASAKFKMRKADGSVAYPISSCDDVKSAWRLRNHAKGLDPKAIVRHIRRAANALDCEGPWEAEGTKSDKAQDKGVNQDNNPELYTFLAMEGDEVPHAQVIQEATQDSGGRMRIKVPFIIGNSRTKAPGFKDPLYFPNSVVADAVGNAKAQIAEGKQPLTVYGRHAHALAFDHYPIGAVIDAEQAVVGGREMGFATLEIEPTSDGKDAMVLLRSNPPKLNAVSLRSAPGKYTFERQKVDGVPHLVAQSPFGISGIDFAPDGPAMETFGVEILHQEARVESFQETSEEETHVPDELTLEMVRANAAIVQELERPLRDQVAALTQERDAVVTERDELKKIVTKAEKDAYVSKIGAKLTEAQRALVQSFAETVETKDQVAVAIAEILLEAPAAQNPTEQSPLDKLKAHFFPTPNGANGAGVAVVQETTPTPEVSPTVVMAAGEDPLPF
jgi:hypothetical protein